MTNEVAVIGAGPAGLMAARTAAGQGLKVVVIEKRRDVSQITRACWQHFIMDDGYENECIQLRDGKIIFLRNGFEVAYNGPAFHITDKYFISPRKHQVHFAHKDGRPIGVKFDKGVLLRGLRESCERLGVEFRNGTVAYDAADSAQGITVNLTCRGAKSTLRARKVIIADGANSRIADALGMNTGRTLFAIAHSIIYTLEGVKDYERTATKFYMGLAYQSKASVVILPTLEGDHVADMLIMGNKNDPPERIYHNVTTKGLLAPIFEQAKLVKRTGCALKAFTSMMVPFQGNALAIGDAAAYVEVENQGALMCGYHAGKAVVKELTGEKGFEEYTRWWQKSFEFNGPEALRVAQGYALVPTYRDDELDYLFALTEDEVLEGTISQYKSPRLLWDSILRHKEKISRERPELYEKIKRNHEMTLKGTF